MVREKSERESGRERETEGGRRRESMEEEESEIGERNSDTWLERKKD